MTLAPLIPEIVADRMQMLGSRGGMGGGDMGADMGAEMDDRPAPPTRSSSSGSRPPAGSGGAKPAGKFDDLEDDIPF